MDWDTVFEVEYSKRKGAAENKIKEFLSCWNRDLSVEESEGFKEYTSHTVFTCLKMPNKPLPNSYIDFLRYADGGDFQNGERYFQFFNTNDFREMNLAYLFPLWMPNAVSFAMDGCGNHYIFDMREEMKDGEYPIIISHSGNLGFEDARLLGSSFLEVCTSRA
ncbi:SMI1/KNR4 family protein [Aneurinibacillus sp. REN35]|uniref:SMI1/KNR4 family protein n=1 Tax=Aneurinibacillus sp. REN35 TaxID=3237286 RepID=UPI0035291CA5